MNNTNILPDAGKTFEGQLDPSTFKLRRYDVSIIGYETGHTILATSRGKAIADIWRNDAFNGYSFGSFLKIIRCRLSDCQPQPQIIRVGDDLVWGIGHNRQYVEFVPPNGDRIFHSHPLDVMPESARPKAYQPTQATGQEAL